ncbi:MAG: class I fructose-bisphosphate aldolase [Patescibacteria group bacterium]|nr:fructose-bisphosphate aldolase class I [Patescibacteria group bacterium]
MNKKQLYEVAEQLMTPGKGILAADESIETATKRLKAFDIESNEDSRRAYRDLFLSTEGIENYLNGVILFDETIKQDNSAGIPFAQLLTQKGILPGIKVDGGKEIDPNSPKETLTVGLVGLAERLSEYKHMGAKFTKWRAVIKIEGDTLPSKSNIRMEAKRLAQFALVSQQIGLVPIVEPEVLHDGNHTLERAAEVEQLTLQAVFEELESVGVDLKALILKPSMVLPGKDAVSSTPEEVAKSTAEVLLATVPKKLAGVVFLSGGQEPEEATKNLGAIVKAEKFPWPISFSFARALQTPALTVWRGKEENIEKARDVFTQRLKQNQLAIQLD